MAESANVSSKSLEQLESEITCGVCQEHYIEPKLLPCLHYYCKKCVLDLVLKARLGKSFSCPECRNKATVPEEGVDGLKTAFFVNRLKTTVSCMKITHGQVEVHCEACLDGYSGKAEAFCLQCAAFICEDCVKFHQRNRQYSKHEISSLDDLKQGKCKPVEKKEDLPDKCEDHDEPQVIYCYDCDALNCYHCIMIDHKEHNFDCKKAASHAKRELSQELNPLKQLKAEYLHAAELVQMTKQEMEDQGLSVAKEIKTAFSEFHQILNEREKELLQEAETKVGKKVEKLCEQEKMLTRASVEIQGVVGYTEKCLSLCTDTEIMGLLAETKTKIRRETEEHSKMSLEPTEEVDIGVAVGLADDLKQLCQDIVNIFSCPIDLKKSVISIEMPKLIQVHDNLELALQLELVLQNNECTKRPRPVTAVIKSKYSGTTSKCDVIQNTANSYSIHYKVADRGCHEVVMLVDGQEVPGSPFPFVASLSPTKLGQPVKIWNQIFEACAITTNSTGEILVTEKCGDILKFGKDGSRQTLVKKSGHSLNTLRGIAVDSDDNIYCTEEHSSKILKCDKNGTNVRVHDVKQKKGKGHRGVVIVGEEVLACSAGVRDTILVYNRSLKYVRKILCDGGRWFYDISADNQHNLFVADYTTNSIHVFSIDGTHLHSFNKDRHGERKVYSPYSVHVFQQHVYIGNYQNDTVSVFTTDGTHVNTFGSNGSGNSRFKDPYSITVDGDGCVCVADRGNNRVQCF